MRFRMAGTPETHQFDLCNAQLSKSPVAIVVFHGDGALGFVPFHHSTVSPIRALPILEHYTVTTLDGNFHDNPG